MIGSKFLKQAFTNDIGIDLGTCNTLIYISGLGIVVNEPSVVSIERGTNRVVAVGDDAKAMLWKTPENIIAKRPLSDGVISDLEMTERMIRYFIAKIHRKRWLVKPRMVIGVPACITQVERRAVEESAYKAGAREVKIVIESLAAAIGARIPIYSPSGHMIIDIGGGTSEISVISLGGMVVTNAIRIGGDEFDDAIIKHMRLIHGMNIGESTAESLKIKIGTALPGEEVKDMEIRGTDRVTGLPRRLKINSAEICEAISEPLTIIMEEVRRTLGQTPPELAADIVECGIVMTGGGALLQGFDKYISAETGVPTFLAEEPMNCVAIGAGKYYEHDQIMRSTHSISNT